MAFSKSTDRYGHAARFVTLVGACALLAGCNGSMSKVDSKYGVSASARVVAAGQPVPKGGGSYRVGKPYTIAGRVYTPEENPEYAAEGVASFYADDFHGRFTANGEIFDRNSISAAHPTLPLPSYVRVTNLKNSRSIVVRVNDRGPYAHGRVIDLSAQTAKLLGFHGHGLAKVRVEYVGKAPLAGSDDTKLMATLRNRSPREMLATRIPDQAPEKSVDTPPDKPIVMASAKPFGSELFDARPMTQTAPRTAPAPVARDISSEPAFRAAPAIQRSELAALQAPPAVSPSSPGRLTSPVSAYAAPRYDAAPGFMSGRGLY